MWIAFISFMGSQRWLYQIETLYSLVNFGKNSRKCSNFNSSFHPQADGQSEVVNMFLETYLRCFCCHKPQDWPKWLSWAWFWYNTNWHTSTKITPYQALYGRPPLTVAAYLPKTTRLRWVEELLERTLPSKYWRIIWLRLRKKKWRKQETEAEQRENVKGDLVCWRLQPYRQVSVGGRSQKLSPLFYSPHQIL